MAKWVTDLQERVQQRREIEQLKKHAGTPESAEVSAGGSLEGKLAHARREEAKLRLQRLVLEQKLAEQQQGSGGYIAETWSEPEHGMLAISQGGETPGLEDADDLVLVDRPGGQASQKELQTFLGTQQRWDGHLSTGPSPEVAARAIRSALGLPQLPK
eukprot:TRINITY_DN26408_c0_g1_i1.p1 TRINITY_DN26408_c0_g1~~TRINITY_DN26408_c0_g1_i1.p1  ORF type:complete len:181 (-),score=40.09 TRINITY_DN26408_c0_g1_i1:8-481(-)